MCLCYPKEVDLEVVKAYKVFSVKGSRLYSAFSSAYIDTPYELNERIYPLGNQRYFSAFVNEVDALECMDEGRECWNFMQGNLVVLEVLLYNVRRQGTLIDSSYKVYESEEIYVPEIS